MHFLAAGGWTAPVGWSDLHTIGALLLGSDEGQQPVGVTQRLGSLPSATVRAP